VRRRPYSVLLFDEIEKAHADVFNLLLQVLDDGRLTDSQGRVVDFRNTVIIMTSNLGSRYILETQELDKIGWNEIESKVLEELRRHFRPEFLNRVDDVVVFHPLTREDLDRIVALQLGRLRSLVSAKGMVLDVKADAMLWLSEAGFDPLYGARPLKRVIQRELQNPIAMALLEGNYAEGDTIQVKVEGEKLAFKRIPAAS
jgi:ATP-dependent Clp protease ATP-binding subunit ClpB